MPDVAVWPACDAACVFCSNPGGPFRRPLAEHALPELVRRLGLYRAGLASFAKFDAARDAVTLTGGEPTLHPRFLALLGAVRRLFPYALIRLLTHGRRFADAGFASRVLAAAGAPFEAAVNLAGPEHGLERALRGTANLLALSRPGQTVGLRTVLTAPVLGRLEGLAALAVRRLKGLTGWALLFPEFEGRALSSPDVVGLRMVKTAGLLAGLRPRLERAAPLSLYHLPLCVLAPSERALARSTLDPAKVVFGRQCRSCALRPDCVGIHKSYACAVGVGEFVATPAIL